MRGNTRYAISFKNDRISVLRRVAFHLSCGNKVQKVQSSTESTSSLFKGGETGGKISRLPLGDGVNPSQSPISRVKSYSISHLPMGFFVNPSPISHFFFEKNLSNLPSPMWEMDQIWPISRLPNHLHTPSPLFGHSF